MSKWAKNAAEAAARERRAAALETGDKRKLPDAAKPEDDSRVRILPIDNAPDGPNRDEHVREAVVVAKMRQFMQSQMLEQGIDAHWNGRKRIVAQLVACEEWEGAQALLTNSQRDPAAPKGIDGPKILRHLRVGFDETFALYRVLIDTRGEWK